MRPARWIAVGVFGPIAAYLCAAFIGALWPAKGVTSAGDEAWIILVQGPIHYDILLPLDEDTRAAFGFVAQADVPIHAQTAAWLSVGWGSTAFYTTAGSYADITAGALWRAATGDSAVMRFDVFGPLPQHPALRRVPVTHAQLDRLRAGLRAQLATPPVPAAAQGFTGTDAFYEAKGAFDLLRTCNVWVGRMLREAGVPFGRWTPTPFAVTASLRWNGLIP